MQTTMIIQENGVFIPVAKGILEQIKASHTTQVNYDYSNEVGFSVTPVAVATNKPNVTEKSSEQEDLPKVLAELAKRKDLKISPEVAELAGALQPYVGLSDEEIDEKELAFLQVIKQDDERTKSYYLLDK